MNKYLLVPAPVAALAVITGCKFAMPVTIQHADLGQPSKAEMTASPASERQAPAGQPEQVGSPAMATPTPSPSPAASPEVKGIRVTGHIYGTSLTDPWNSPALVHDTWGKADGRNVKFEAVLTPDAQGKTYLYANTTGWKEGAVDHVRADHGKLYGGQYVAIALKWIKVQVPDDKSSVTQDVYLGYPIGHALAGAPGTHSMGFPTHLGETKRVITVAPMFKNGERRYKTPLVAETIMSVEQGKTYQVETDGASSVKLENIEDGRWYAYQVKLTLPKGEAETTVGLFLGGRTAKTVLLGEAKPSRCGCWYW